VSGAFTPPAAAATATGFDPIAIGAALLGVALVLTYLLPWISGGNSDHAFELAGDGRGSLGDLGTRTDIGIVLMQALYGAIVLGPVAAVLFVARQPAARLVGALAGAAGIIVVIGRFLLELPGEIGLGVGTWVSLAVSVALLGAALASGRRAGTAPGPSSW